MYSDKIKFLNFDRKKFLKDFKTKTEWAIISSKSFRTSNKKLMELNFKRIYSFLNFNFQKSEIFSNNNIYLVLNTLGEYYDFLKDFELVVNTINDIDTLKDKQIAFFNEQAKLEKFLKDNLIQSKGVILKDE